VFDKQQIDITLFKCLVSGNVVPETQSLVLRQIPQKCRSNRKLGSQNRFCINQLPKIATDDILKRAV
jgi:hypothetical protein